MDEEKQSEHDKEEQSRINDVNAQDDLGPNENEKIPPAEEDEDSSQEDQELADTVQASIILSDSSASHDSNQSDEEDEDDGRLTEIGFLTTGTVVPGVQWIYPDQDLQSEHHVEDDTTGSHTYQVNPDDVYIQNQIEEVEGVIVSRQRCVVKLFGFQICSDSFRYYVNPKFFIVAILLIFSVVFAVTFKTYSTEQTPPPQIADPSHNASQQPLSENMTSLAPSPAVTIPLDPRTVNITNVILNVSGDVAIVTNTSQNKALKWILNEDPMLLEYDSSNLVQRYIMMVFFYSLSGGRSTDEFGFGSEKHECKWLSRRSECNSRNRVIKINYNVNNLEGSIPRELSKLSSLTEIRLSQNKITGTIPSEIGELKQLEVIRLQRNELSGTLPREISNCRGLIELDFSRNNIHGNIPSIWGSMPSLSLLSLEQNELSGTLPSDLGRFRAIATMKIHTNQLTGSIPFEFGDLHRTLNVLELNRNNLVGSIPSSIGKLSNLQALVLHENSFSGAIPSSIYENLSKIHTFSLYDNRLTGTIPNMISFWSKVEDFDLSFNHGIYGTIPRILGNFTMLESMSLHSTNLTGIVPTELCSFIGLRLKELRADCSGESPKVSCDCCTECF